MLIVLNRRENPTMPSDAMMARTRPDPALASAPPRTQEDPFAMPPWMPRLGGTREGVPSEDPELRAVVLGVAGYCVTLAVLGVVAGILVLG